MRKTLLSSLLVGLLTLVGVSQVWAQSVKFTENYYKGYHVASDAETRNFTILTLDKCNWMEIAGYTNINTNLPLSTTEYTQCICRANDYSWACDLMEWFTTTYSVPSYSSASFTTKCLVKVYKAASQYYVIRAAYFDFGEDPSNYWSGRKNDPLGYEYYRTASNCANGGYYWGTDKFYGEKCAVWAYTTHNWSQNVANVDVVSMDNSTGSSDLTTNRYGAFLTSKTISYNWIQNRCHTELYFTYTVDMSYHKIFTFDANGGTGSIAVQNIKNSGNLTTNTPTRTGYTFAGWNTAANGTGTAYTGGQAITATSSDKGAITLYAQWTKIDPVSYLYPEYNTEGDPTSGIKAWKTDSCTDYKVVEDASSQVTWNAGWYVVNGTDVKLTAGAVCNGAVNLILADGAKLTANGANFAASITVSGVNNFLTIYGQANQSGQLIATGGKNGSAIGGGQTAPGSNITINGGVVNAMGGLKGAGIGSGASDGTTGLAGSNITINGGTVTATGGGNAAGIGGGGGNYAAGSYITINGGTVTATGGSAAAGIGGGYAGAGSNITINGGEVTATGDDGAGIGGGCYGAGSYITIHGGTVTAKGGNNAAGIGSGEMGSSASNIFVNPSLILKAGASANPTDVIASTRTATTDIAEDLAGKQYATVTEPQQPVSYIVPVYNTASDPKSGILRWDTLSCTDYKVMDGGYDTWETGWYVVTSDITFEEGIICNGAVHLILADDAKLTINAENGAGITVSGDANSLTIYGQANQSGQLIATGGYESASIGGIEEGDGSNITINGGKVTATAYGNGAAIGGGKEGSGSYITINGGTVTATSEGAAAGIGGGDGGIGSNITINGGTVTATGGYNAAGIGGGFMGNGSYITIYGGTVTATGGNSAAGIGGGGNGGEGSYITIHGGTVTATGGSYGAGIGGGKGGEGKYITINDGEVNATGGENAAGIGGGDGGIGLNITIHGGTVTATGGNGAAGIGGGPGEIGTDITINGGTVTATGGENAAGIGGGRESRGLYITIKSGIVTATGGEGAAGIGSGVDGDAASNIFVDPSLILKAGASANPTDVIASTRTATTDIAGDLAGKQYATVTEPEPIYTRKVTNGNFGTICLAKAFSDVKGIEGLYKPATQATDFSVLYCTEVLLSEVKAGESYIFQADSDVVVFTLEGEAVTAAVVANNMLGNLGDTVIVDESFIATYSDYSILGTPAGASEQQMVKLVVGSKLMPNRAMINLKTVPATGAPQPTPGRRIATIGRNVPTGLVDVNANLNETRKVMINGQLIIIRDSKMFNAQGQKL